MARGKRRDGNVLLSPPRQFRFASLAAATEVAFWESTRTVVETLLEQAFLKVPMIFSVPWQRIGRSHAMATTNRSHTGVRMHFE